MKKLILMILFIFGYSLDINYLKNLLSDKPEWIKKIDNGENIIKKGYHCWSVKLKNGTRKDIINNIKSQIVSDIISVVSSSINVNKSYVRGKMNSYFNKKLKIESIGIVRDIQPITKKYGDFLYGYYCIKNEKYEELKKENDKRRKEFLSLYDKFMEYINRNDTEGAKKILNKIEVKFMEYVDSDIFQMMKNELENRVYIDINIPHSVKYGIPLNISIYSNKDIYVNVINLNNNTLLISDEIIVKGEDKKIKLIPYVNTSKFVRLQFIFTKIPLYLNKFILTNKKLSKRYNAYLRELESNNLHYISIISKIVKVKKTLAICLYSNTNNKYINQILEDMNHDIINCNKTYKIELKINEKKFNNVINFKGEIILYKNNIPINKKIYFQQFPSSQKSYMYNYYIVPELEKIILEFKNSI